MLVLFFQVFGPDTQLNTGPGATGLYGAGPTTSKRALFLQGDTLYAVWAEELTGEDTDILFSWSPDFGATWAEPVRVGEDDTSDQEFPSIWVSEGVVYIAYRDWSPGYPCVKLAKSEDLASFVICQVDSVQSNHNLPSVWCFGDTVALAWQDNRFGDFDILFSVSADGGLSWSGPVRVSQGTGLQRSPCLAGDGSGHLFLVWEDARGSDWDIYFARSEDWGASWEEVGPVNQSLGGWQVQPSLFFSAGKVIAAWADGRSSPWQVYLAYSEDFGDTWTELQGSRVPSDPVGGATAPSVWAWGDTVALVWHDERTTGSDGNYHIFFNWTPSLDTGAFLPQDVRVDEPAGDSKVAPAVCAGPRGFCVLWSDNRVQGGTRYDVFFSRSQGSRVAERVKFPKRLSDFYDLSGRRREARPRLRKGPVFLR